MSDRPTVFDIQEEIRNFCKATLDRMVKNSGSETYETWLNQWREFHKAYLGATADLLRQRRERFGLSGAEGQVMDEVAAHQVVVEVVDQKTGYTLRRELPIDYFENDNGVILRGETFEGKPGQLAFLSEAALNKINDLVGKGPDRPRNPEECDAHHCT
jgi:hypothetical protein